MWPDATVKSLYTYNEWEEDRQVAILNNFDMDLLKYVEKQGVGGTAVTIRICCPLEGQHKNSK